MSIRAQMRKAALLAYMLDVRYPFSGKADAVCPSRNKTGLDFVFMGQVTFRKRSDHCMVNMRCFAVYGNLQTNLLYAVCIKAGFEPAIGRT